MNTVDPDTRAYGPATADPRDASWLEALEPLFAAATGTVAVNRGWDLAWETGHLRRSAAAGREHLSARLYADEVIVGPRWVPGTDSGCAGCAEVRERAVREHPLLADLAVPTALPSPGQPLLPEIVAAAAANLAEHPLRPGELCAIGTGAVRRHRVPRSFFCPLCAERRQPGPDRRPEPLALRSRPAADTDPTRAADGVRLVARHALRDRLVDDRYGPVQAVLRESGAPFAMTMAVLPDAPAWGHGRGLTFGETEPVAIIEGYERLGGFPFEAPVLMDLAYEDIAEIALDPVLLGTHTEQQLNHRTSRVLPFDHSTRMDWTWGHDLGTGEPRLVPAEAGFYQYEYRHKLDRRAARAARRRDPRENKKHFYDSSSGCAAGSCLEEAALHSLLELAERDAFLLSWHKQVPLPEIEHASITDPESRAMIDLIHARDFDIHILVATQDIDLPIVWTLAVNRSGVLPAAFCSGGSGANPASAIRGALREVAQLVTDPVDPDTSDIEPFLADPWNLEELVHHPRLYMHPDTLPRMTTVLGGPRVGVGDAFPDWPDRLRRAAGGDVRGALDHVRGLFAAAGLDTVILVDQTTREHADAGISIAKAVVPGILPVTFGHAQQRLQGLRRLADALAGTPQADREIPYDPHPFP
jgi:ribosomal protein S12 methylthiotransferase accessory factor